MFASRLLAVKRKWQPRTSRYRTSSSCGQFRRMSSHTSRHLFLIGLDVIREYGIGHRLPPQPCLQSHHETLPSLCSSSDGALEMTPNKSEQGQRPASSLSTRRWGRQPRAQEKGTRSLESSTFHLREEESEHDREHTSTSEDDLLELLGMSEDTHTWQSFDKREKTYLYRFSLRS